MTKNNLNSYSGAWGLFLAPFLMYGISLLFSPSNPTEQELNKYVKGSDSLTLKIDRLVIFHFRNGKKKINNSIPYFTNFRKNRYKDYIEIHSSTYNKYFVVENYNNNEQSLFNVREFKAISGMVNLDELRDSSFGTREKPIPILWITGDSSFSESGYKYNVNEYLRFFKGRQKFDKEPCMVCAF